MGLIKEPKNVDFTVQSEPWTEEELKDFRKLMGDLKAKNVKKKVQPSTKNRKVGTKKVC
jgi:hypothetical protein